MTEWAKSVGDLDALYEARSESSPLLDPATEATRRRWNSTLAWYTSHGGHVGGRIPEADDGRDWIVSIGLSAAGAGTYLAHVLGRGHLPLAGIDDLLAWVRTVHPQSVLLLLPFRGLHPSDLSRLSASLTELGVSAGYLPSDDPGALSFAITKLRLSHSVSLPEACTIDAARREIRFSDRVSDFTAEELRGAFEAEWGALTLQAHGEGAHLHVGLTVLCGAVGAEHVRGSGRVVVGGCEEGRRCKRAAAGLRPMFLTQQRSVYLGLLTCTSIRASCGYPSDVDLARAALTSYPALVVGVTCRLTAWPHLSSLMTALLADGWAAGDVVRLCNEALIERGRDEMLLLLGDPLWRLLSPEDAGKYNPAAGRVRCAPLIDGGPRPAVCGIADTSSSEPSALLVARNRICTWTTTAEVPEVRDWSDRLCSIGESLDELRVRCEGLGPVERALIRTTRTKAKALRSVREDIASLREARSELDLRIANATVGCQRIRASGLWNTALERGLGRVRDSVRRWDDAVCDVMRHILFDANVMNDPLYGALHREAMLGETMPAERPCPHCSRTLEKRVHTGVMGTFDRSTVECAACGPYESFASCGPRLAIHSETECAPGGVLTLAVHVYPIEALFDLPGRLMIEARGWSTGLLLQHDGPVSSVEENMEFSIHVPGHCPPEQCSVQATWTQELHVAYAMHAFYVVPGRTEPPQVCGSGEA